VGKFLGHSDWVQSLAFSPDGMWLASGGFDRLVKIWKAGPVLQEPMIAN
jgi:WD40 repeat protein